MNEDQGPYQLIINDELAIKQAMAASDMLSAISDLKEWIRHKWKYEGKENVTIDELQEMYSEIFGAIPIDKLCDGFVHFGFVIIDLYKAGRQVIKPADR